ncbi:MAG TPA: hypothetical protein VNF72_03850 [Myxococcota bacterium]|nr:hypothetical protein [Myxococcota bacterium]
MRHTLCVWLTVCCTASLFAAGSALAIGHGTPDGSPPAEESVCDDAGLVGAAYGLCVAYCEAQDCDAFPDKPACDRLFDNYVKITGAECFPCDTVTEPPPTD